MWSCAKNLVSYVREDEKECWGFMVIIYCYTRFCKRNYTKINNILEWFNIF